MESGAGGDAHNHAFRCSHEPSGLKGVLVRNRDDLVVNACVEHIGNKARADSLDFVGACRAGRKDGGGLGFHGNYFDA